MSTINVLDSSGAVVPLEKPLAPSRAAAALSRPVALSTEDKAALDLIATNQTSQVTQETAINTVLGVKTDAKATATDGTSVSAISIWKQISASVQAMAAGGGGTVVTLADGANVTQGAKADAKAATTDATPITAMSVWKQISFSVQAIAASLAGTLTVASHAVTNAGTFAVQVSNANGNGRALPAGSAPVVLNSMTYSAKAASVTASLFGATGASGDYLDGVLIIPATVGCGLVSIRDGSGSDITIFIGGGTTALADARPFYVPIGAISSGGAGGWKVTTGANVSVIGVGNFT